MIRSVLTISHETFLLLRRDRVFVPAVVIALTVAAFANIASEWSVEDFTKILFDIGFFGFQFTGGIVAVFWGTRVVSDSRQEGALEVQLAAPVSRTAWLLGKFFGLSVCLVALAVLLLAIWQGFMLLNDFGWMTRAQLWVFAFMVLGWLVLAAMAVMFASVMNGPLAMFATLCLWVAGMASTLIENTLSAETPEFSRAVVSLIARYWDLQQLNLMDHTMTPGWESIQGLAWRATYGGLLIAILITVGCLIFARRDIAGHA